MRAHHTFISWGLLLVSIICSAPCRGANPSPLSSLIRQGDIQVWDEQYLRGEPKGWTVPPDYHEAFGGGANRNAIPIGIRFGRFGRLSGKILYSTWRSLRPLSDEIYAAGKTTVFDNHVSELVTPPFEVKLDYLTFLLSGGNMPDEACINLLVDGEVVRTATGRNNDLLEWVAFDMKEFLGKEAQVQVLDTSTAAFGYITVDCICQSPDPKGAVRVISTPPSTSNGNSGRAETLSGQFTGTPEIADSALRLGGQVLDLKNVLLWDTGITPPDATAAKRLELVNGDTLVAEVLGLEEEKLLIRHTALGEMSLPVGDIAQALFMPVPSVVAAPGTLIHSNGNKIPGELLWIREGNISIKCSLGVIPLPRARVHAFVFSERKPATKVGDTVVLADGSTLSGKLSLDKDTLLLDHDVLGPLELTVRDIARIARSLPGVTPFASLSGKIEEQVGPIPPPAPLLIQDESGESLRMFPRTAMRYTLPSGTGGKRFRATLAPVANSRIPMTAQIRAGSINKTFTVPSDSTGVEVDIELGSATQIQIITDSAETISYPCGIEWRNAFIIEDNKG